MFKTPPRKTPVPDARIVWPRNTSSKNLQENGWMCNCNPRGLAPVLTANTTRNRGRKFYACEKGRGNSSCNFFVWAEEAQVAEAAKGYSFSESKVRALREAVTAVAAVAASTTPKYLRQSKLSWPTPLSRKMVSSTTRSGTCYSKTTAPVLLPSKAPASPLPPSRAKRRRESSPSNEVLEQGSSPHKHRRTNRATKNPYSTSNPSRSSTPKPPPSPSTPSRKAVRVTTGTWDHRSIAPSPSETDADGCGSDNNTVTPSLSPAPSPRRRLFGPTTPPRAAGAGSWPSPFSRSVESSPGRGVRFDVRMAVFELVRAEGIELKGAGNKLWDILEKEVKQKEGVCKGREIARTAHQRATDVIAGLNRRIAELEKEITELQKERDEVRAANMRPKVTIDELEAGLGNAGLQSQTPQVIGTRSRSRGLGSV